MSHARYLGVALAVAGMCVGAVAFSVWTGGPSCTTPPTAPKQDSFSWSRTKTVWLSILTKCGTTQAYTLFAESVAAEKPKWQHILAHVFGDALFDVKGIGGITVCDTQFMQGCFHGLVERAMQISGIDTIRNLEDICYKNLPPIPAKNCVHGIGHGLLNIVGYTQDGLTRSLALCDTLTHTGSSNYCSGGIFMEYNAHILTDQAPREAGANLLAPCDTVPTDKRETCYFWQSQWWDTTFSGSATGSESAITQTAALCRRLPKIYYRGCFEGIGRAAGHASPFDKPVAGALCDAASSGDTSARLYCRSYAAAFFNFALPNPSGVLELCASFNTNDRRICEDYAQHSYNTINPGPLEAPTR